MPDKSIDSRILTIQQCGIKWPKLTTQGQFGDDSTLQCWRRKC